MGKQWKQWLTLFFWATKSLQMVIAATKLKDITPWKKSYDLPSSTQFICQVVSDSLRLHELQHTRSSCPSPIPGVHSNPYPLSRWCHPTILSSVVLFSTRPQFFPAVMYGCESWSIKKAKHLRIDAFELWYWRRLL